MRHGRVDARGLAILIAAGAAAFAPSGWVAVPSAALLLFWLAGRSLLRCLPELDGVPGRSIQAVAASLVLMPVPLWWVWQVTNTRVGLWVAVVAINVALYAASCVLGGRRPTAPVSSAPAAAPVGPSSRYRAILTVIVLWTAGCVFLSFWLPQAGGRTRVTSAHDYVKHHAVMMSLDRHPLPLHNMFFAAEADAPYYYYEYYYLMPATLRVLSGRAVSIALAFGAAAALAAVMLILLVFLLARGLSGCDAGGVLAAACVSVVGGFDVLPVLVRMANGGSPVVTLDAWCPVPWRIHNLATQFMWCPQHVAAVVVLLLVALWLRHAPHARWWLIVGPLAAAAVFGTSVYLAILIFLAAAPWCVVHWRDAVRARRLSARQAASSLAVMATVATGLMIVQAWHYAVMAGRYHGGLTLQWDRFPFALLGRLVPPGPLANYLDMPWLLLIDVGLPAIACVVVARTVWRAAWADAGMRLVLIVAALGPVAMFTVRSDVNPYDYGFRLGLMPAMAAAAILTGALVDPRNIRRRVRPLRVPLLVGGVLLGLPVGLFELPVSALRSRLMTDPMDREAAAIHFIRANTPEDTVVQGDPQSRFRLPERTDRPTGILDPSYSHIRVFTPPAPRIMEAAYEEVTRAFLDPQPQRAAETLRRWGIDVVFVGWIEWDRYGLLPQFHDANHFALLYNDRDVEIYRVLDDPRGDPR